MTTILKPLGVLALAVAVTSLGFGNADAKGRRGDHARSGHSAAAHGGVIPSGRLATRTREPVVRDYRERNPAATRVGAVPGSGPARADRKPVVRDYRERNPAATRVPARSGLPPMGRY